MTTRPEIDPSLQETALKIRSENNDAAFIAWLQVLLTGPNPQILITYIPYLVEGYYLNSFSSGSYAPGQSPSALADFRYAVTAIVTNTR